MPDSTLTISTFNDTYNICLYLTELYQGHTYFLFMKIHRYIYKQKQQLMMLHVLNMSGLFIQKLN